jgi:hypothetical protein
LHLRLGVHIRFCGDGCWRFRSYSDSLLQTPKRKQNALPLHSVPRLGSACPHSGIAPGARRHRPSMAGGGYRGILASVPPAQRLRSASGKGASRSRSKAKATATATATARSTASRASRIVAPPLPHKADRRTAFASHHSTGRALARLQLLILMHRPIERPSGGSAQWASRHGCRVSRPRPWMADGGGPTEQDRSEGMPSLGEAPNERGKSPWLLGALPSDSL